MTEPMLDNLFFVLKLLWSGNLFTVCLNVLISLHTRMKTKKKVLYDNSGSASQMRAIVRDALWGLVEKISREHINAEEEGDELLQPEDLPLQFSSNKKRKNSNKNQNAKKKQSVTSAFQLPSPKYNGTLLEDNVYLISHHDQYKNMIIRIKGVGSLPKIVVGRLIGKIGVDDETNCGRIIQLNRTQLREIPTTDNKKAHQLVQLDEQRILQEGMPTGVHLKYWDQRYRLMQLFDKGIKLDAESWYSITPEAVAKHVTSSCIGRARELGCDMDKVLDCFSGCGGNTIPFAQLGKKVVSIDFDAHKLDFLRHNCKVYGVAVEPVCMCSDVYAVLEALIGTSELTSIKDRYDNILCTEKAAEEYEETAEASKESSEEHSQGESVTDEVAATGEKADTSLPEQEVPEPDPEQLALCYDADLIILSPPWGGPDYLHAETYCLYTMLTCGCGLYLAMLAAAVSPNLLFLIPVNTSQQQIAHIASVLHMPFVIEYVQVNNSPKVMAVYMGEIVNHARKHQQKGKKIFKGADELINRSGHVFFDEL